MRIVLLGPFGSGTTELAHKIAEKYQLSVITQSTVLDKVAGESSEIGRLAREARDTSRVSDNLLIALLRMQLPDMDLNRGYVLVDMPRSETQITDLEALLGDFHIPFDLVINLDVDADDLMERLVGHIACDQCGANYNLYVNPPMVDGVCDMCGARVVKRPDDYEETISNRLRLYDIQMAPVLEHYASADKLKRFDIKLDAMDASVEAVCTYINSLSLQSQAPSQANAKQPLTEIDTTEATEALQAAINAMSPKPAKAGSKKAAVKKAVTKKAGKKRVAKKSTAKTT